MTIAFSIESLNRGGKERQLLILADNLKKRGYQVAIFTNKVGHANYLTEYPFLKDSIQINEGKGLTTRYVVFKKQIGKTRPDCIITYDIFTSVLCLLLYKKQKFTFINFSIQHGIRLLNFWHLFRSFICWMSPFNMANSVAGFKANNLKPGKTNFILYNGIENKFQATISDQEKRKRLTELIPGYDPKFKILTSVANFVPYKDYFSVLSALSEVKESLGFYYLIIGYGSMQHQVEQKITECGLQERVFLLGKQEQVEYFLAVSDYFIHSSRGEGVSNAILEAMFAGIPVIATHVGGTPEVLYQGASVMFEYKDVGKLVWILQNLDTQFPGFNSRAVEYQQHLKTFSVDNMVDSFISIMRQIGISSHK